MRTGNPGAARGPSLPGGPQHARFHVTLLVFLTAAAVFAAGFLLPDRLLSKRSRVAVETAPSSSAIARFAASARAREPTPGSVRARVREVIRDDAARVTAPAEVEAYLDQLEQKARSEGRVTAFEVEPGADAIRRSGGDPVAVSAFYARMAKLSAELDRRSVSDEPLDLDEIADRFEEAEGDAKRDWRRRYLAAASSLDDEARVAAIARLQQLTNAPSHDP
jgi:hypothetical protein